MIPQILQLGPIPVNSFGLMVALAILAGIFSMQRSFERYGLDPALAESYVLTAGLTGIIGARILHLIENYSEIKEHFWSAVFASAGFTFYGGFILAAIVLIVKAKRHKFPLAKLANATAPAIALGYAIGRLGCQLSGDGDYGRNTDSILGMSYSTGVIPTPPGVLVFPTPLYESTICLLIAAVLYKLEENAKWREKKLYIFGVGLILLSLERFFVEFLRINPSVLGSYSEAQVIALCLMILGAIVLLMSKENTISHKPS